VQCPYKIAAFLALAAISGCVSDSGTSASGSKSVAGKGVSASEAIAQFSRHCLSALFEPAANEASFRADANYVQKGAPFEFKSSKITTFAHTTRGIEGSAGTALGAPSCSISYKPDGDLTDSAVDAAIQLAAIAGTNADPFGMKGQGFIIMKYKDGNLTLNLDQKNRDISLSASKL
jgi:hypothetical protein